MANNLANFRLSFKKVVCKGCGWPLAREYETGDEASNRIEIKISNYVISLSAWPQYIKCGRCNTLNLPEDMEKHSVQPKKEEVVSQ